MSTVEGGCSWLCSGHWERSASRLDGRSYRASVGVCRPDACSRVGDQRVSLPGPAPAPPPEPQQQPQRASGRGRLFRVMSFVVVLLLGLMACSGVWTVANLLKRFNVTNEATIKYLKAHSAVRSDIGKPMSQSLFISSEQHSTGPNSHRFQADFRLSGPRGEGAVYVTGQSGGSGSWWEIDQLSWTCRGKSQLLIPDNSGKTLRSKGFEKMSGK